ncbi:MAG: ABC transporter substrate-binding protein [Janthinobacterium lividum]
MSGCHGTRTEASAKTVRFLVESSPNNLDLRQGTDAQSERIGALIFDALVHKDEHFLLQPWLATSWERPDPRTWVFHLRPGVRFHDGKPLTADDVVWSIRSMVNGTLATSKGGSFAGIASLAARDPLTVEVHTKEPDPGLLFNLSDGLFGVVEQGAGRDEGLHPVGTGAFRFVNQVQDKEVVLERNADWWNGPPKIGRVRFAVVPDNISMALELKKGSADVESNAITPDEVHALSSVQGLVTATRPGADVYYANFNVTDPSLRDARVRQAIACAIDRQSLIRALWQGRAVAAETLLPPGHWAAAKTSELPQYAFDPARATALLESAGLKPNSRGVRLRFTLKTSTDETTRMLAQVLQQQMRAVGIQLDLRSAEFGTFYADITHGAFQMYILRWTGSNEDPDIFRYADATASFPPRGGNRGHYSNPQIDALLTSAAAEPDDASRRRDYVAVQQLLATDLPSIPLWYPDIVVVHSKRLTNLHLDPGGTFGFLRSAEFVPTTKEAGLHPIR